MGPVVSALQHEKILGYVAAAKREGLQCVYGPPLQDSFKDREDLQGGYFIAPHIYSQVPVSSQLWREEIFGPVLCIRSFKGMDCYDKQIVEFVMVSPYSPPLF